MPAEVQAATDDAVVVVFASGEARQWRPVIDSLLQTGLPVVVGLPGGSSAFAGDRVDAVDVSSIASLLDRVAATTDARWIIAVGEPCLAPVGLAAALHDVADERVATVSFLSNAAHHLSFPFPGVPVPWIIGGGTAQTATDRLRAVSPTPMPAPVPAAAGPAVAVSAPVIRMLPSSWADGVLGHAETMMTLSLCAHERGLLNVLDTSTFVHRAADLAPIAPLAPEVVDRVERRFPWLPAGVEAATTDPESPLRLELRLARVALDGLDLLIDGSCLGPLEMGTQVGLVAICRSLAARSDVRSIAVTLPGTLPAYANELAADDKVTFIHAQPGGAIDTDRHFDLAYRPFQPDETFRAEPFRAVADRVMVSILDLIAYGNGSYFADGQLWLRYRRTLAAALRTVDAATTISDDVIGIVSLERMPIDPDRVHALPYGTEHLGSSVTRTMPAAMSDDPTARFVLCLGTNYGHKNRDLAIRCVDELRRRGHELTLVLAGPEVPFGSTRILESEATVGDRPLVLATVTTSERNWLLAHAEVVLYPTSAEGFGLVPYEAASQGTPTVFVPFGPLAEIGGDLPGLAREWAPASLADAIEAILRDPEIGRLQVAALLARADVFSWTHTADRLVQIIRTVLTRPPIS